MTASSRRGLPTHRVDVECDLDLGHATWRRRDPLELELAKHLVVGRHLALPLEDLDAHLQADRRRLKRLGNKTNSVAIVNFLTSKNRRPRSVFERFR